MAGAGAEVMQAVPTMLELVPAGVNKWVGMRALLADLVRAPLLWQGLRLGHVECKGKVQVSGGWSIVEQCGSANQAPLPAL